MATFQNTNITTKRDVSIHLLFLILVCGMAVVSCRKDELDIDINLRKSVRALVEGPLVQSVLLQVHVAELRRLGQLSE